MIKTIRTLKTGKGTLIELINLGNFLLDGGSMFGRIPKVMWEKWFPSDKMNRIIMATNVIKIHSHGKIYQVDAGLGSLYNEKERKILGFDPSKNTYLDNTVDYLIFTHLHFDHCGGISDTDVKKATIVTEKEWGDANNVSPLTKGSYRKKDLELIERNLRLIKPPLEFAPGIEVIPTPGHTRGHASILIDGEIFFAGDLIPTSAHTHLPCIMAYDLYPLKVLKVKEKMLRIASKQDWTMIFEHDPYMPIKKARDLTV